MIFNRLTNAYPFEVSSSTTLRSVRLNRAQPFSPSAILWLETHRNRLTALIITLLIVTQTSFAANFPAASASAGPKVKVTLRDNGYTLGDLISMRAEFDLAKGLVFDPNSVPLKGPVNNWLDLRDVKMEAVKNTDDSSHVRIDFTWQIFGTVEHAQIIKIPAIQLQTIPPERINNEANSDKTGNTKLIDNKPLAITVPSQGFNLSPVLPPTITENAHRPYAPPLRFNTRTPLTLGLTFIFSGLLCGVLWLWLTDKVSWWPRNPGPITKLARQMRKLGVAQRATFNIEQIRSIHTALATSAGQSLYPNTIAILFEKAPYLAAEKAEITQFFLQTWSLFFEGKRQLTIDSIAVTDTLKWIRRAAVAERIFRAAHLKIPAQKSAHRIARHSANGAVKV